MAPGDDISPPQWVPENPLAGAEDDATRMAPRQERDLAVGDVLKGRFELVEALGAGGMGAVFKARDRLKVEAEDRQPYVAVKVVGREFQRHPLFFKAFQREAKRAQSLAHPNIVRVHDFDRDGPHVFITMEYLSGRPLDKIVKSRPPGEIALKEALKVLEPICSALAFAHDNGIVHCDIKPSNIFVTDEGMVKVIDFGIARAVKRPDGEQTVFDGGTLKAATLAYASPELQAGDAEPSPCDDVYSLACLAYELLTGRHPFDRLPAGSVLARQREPAKPEGLTKTQWAGLRRALAFERDRRTPTVRQLLADLQAEGGRPRWPLAAAAAAVLALAVVGTLVLWEEDGDEREPHPAVGELEVAEQHSDKPAEPAIGGNSTPPSVDSAEPHALPQLQPPQEETGRDERELVALPQVPPLLEAAPVAPDMGKVDRVLREIRCALLEGEAKNGLVEVRGHAAPALANWVRELRTLPGVEDVIARVDPLSTVHCPTIEMFAPLLQAARRRNQELSFATDSALRDGDPLTVDVIAPMSGFLYIDYFSADGTVVHLLPRPHVMENRIERGDTVRLGRGEGTGAWLVGPPFGTEIVTALVTPEPLFADERVELETAFGYREDLKRALEQIVRRRSIDGIGAAVTFVTIEPQSGDVTQ